MYSADHVIIKRTDFEALLACSEKCQVQAIFIIIDVASSLGTAHPEINIDPHSSLFHPEIATKPPIQYVIPRPPTRLPPLQSAVVLEAGLPFIGYAYKRFTSRSGYSNPTRQGTAVQLNQKSLDALKGDQPVLIHNPYRARSVSPSRFSDRIDPAVSVAIPPSSQEPDRRIDPSHASSISPISPLSSPARFSTTPNLNGGSSGELYPTMATSIQLQASLGPPINNPQLQKSQGQQIISQSQLRAASQSQYLGKLLESPNRTVQTEQTQFHRIEVIRQQQGLNPSPSNVQSQQPIPMGSAADFGSFMWNMENINDQQQQGLPHKPQARWRCRPVVLRKMPCHILSLHYPVLFR